MEPAADIVVLSPHFDDAVISLGGMIGREAARGRKVEVWTCFTTGPALETLPASQRSLADYAARQEEDRRALAVLGATARSLHLRERIWRDPPLRHEHHIFHTPPSLEGFAALSEIRQIAGELIRGRSQVFAPLGAGHHHDHMEVVLAVLLEMLSLNRPDRVDFYEDPYAQGGGCRRARLHYPAPILEAMERTGLGQPANGRASDCSGDVFTRSQAGRLSAGSDATPLDLH